MQYEDRIICYLDILGFSDHIRHTVNGDGSDNETNIAAVAETFEIVRQIINVDKPEDNGRAEITQFSDCIVISFPVEETSGLWYYLHDLMMIQVALVRNEMLCRGAVVRGKLFHTSKILFGPAMNDVYILESRVANYPRVILEESIINTGALAHAKHHGEEFERESILKLLSRDGDGLYYIDYLTKVPYQSSKRI